MIADFDDETRALVIHGPTLVSARPRTLTGQTGSAVPFTRATVRQ